MAIRFKILLLLVVFFDPVMSITLIDSDSDAAEIDVGECENAFIRSLRRHAPSPVVQACASTPTAIRSQRSPPVVKDEACTLCPHPVLASQQRYRQVQNNTYHNANYDNNNHHWDYWDY